MSAPVRPKPPAAPVGVRPLAVAVAREAVPEDATVPMQRSDYPPDDNEWTEVSPPRTRELAPQPGSPKPPAAVHTDANALRAALQDALEPMQRALDDLTMKIARERVDRKEAIERLERTVARVATATPPPTQVQASPPTAAAPLQPFAVSPSAHPPPVVAIAPPLPIPSPTPPIAKAPSPAPPRVVPLVAPAAAPGAAPAAPAPVTQAPVVATVQPSVVPVVHVASAPAAMQKFELDPYSIDLSFDLPPELDGSRKKRIMGWLVTILILGGVIAIVASMLYSRSRGPGQL